MVNGDRYHLLSVGGGGKIFISHFNVRTRTTCNYLSSCSYGKNQTRICFYFFFKETVETRVFFGQSVSFPPFPSSPPFIIVLMNVVLILLLNCKNDDVADTQGKIILFFMRITSDRLKFLHPPKHNIIPKHKFKKKIFLIEFRY